MMRFQLNSGCQSNATSETEEVAVYLEEAKALTEHGRSRRKGPNEFGCRIGIRRAYGAREDKEDGVVKRGSSGRSMASN